jgi:hypothetical protein
MGRIRRACLAKGRPLSSQWLDLWMCPTGIPEQESQWPR